MNRHFTKININLNSQKLYENMATSLNLRIQIEAMETYFSSIRLGNFLKA